MSEGRRSCPGAREAGRREERRPRAAPGSRGARLAARFALRGGAAIRGRARACVCGVATSGGTWTACACVCVSPPSEVVKRWRARPGGVVRGHRREPGGRSQLPGRVAWRGGGCGPPGREAGRPCLWRVATPRPGGALGAEAGAASCSGGEIGVFLPRCHGGGSSREEAPACQRPCCCVCRVCDCL